MIKISKELEFLKKKADEQEFQMRRDERVNSLSKQLEWFRQEALILSSQNDKLKKQNSKNALLDS